MKINKKLLFKSFQWSIVVQILTGLISTYGFFLKLSKIDRILYDILLIETIVQLVEGCWYILITAMFKNIKETSLAAKRYIDWVFTTPVMLFSTVLFMEYDYLKKNKTKNTTEEITTQNITTQNIVKNYKIPILKIVLYNFFMLAFGYLGETLKKYQNQFLFIGFLFFFLTFYEIYINFVKTEKAKNLFIFIFTVWFFYGVAAYFTVIPKNIFYNILDIIAKNFYGLYILYEIVNLQQKKEKKILIQ